jgi:hypothetical protein
LILGGAALQRCDEAPGDESALAAEVMMIGSKNTCTSCFGNGSCPQCDGAGLAPSHGDDERKCQSCSGTGVCTACNGTGAWTVPPPEIIDLGLVNLGLANNYSETSK